MCRFRFGSSVTGPASAQQDFPTKPIRIVVGVAPGGATDILARVLGTKMGENLRQQVIVDNRPGANHIIGGQLTQKSPPDGYTIQVIPEGWVINASMYSKLPFDPVRDFTPIAIMALVPNALVIHPSLPVRNVKQFIALARARPGQMNYGTSGVGAPSHMSAELLKVLTRVEYTHVPYKGQAPRGDGPARRTARVRVSDHHRPRSGFIRSGRLVALGVTTAQRATALPDVPTIQEAGVPGYEVAGWYGVIGPAGMPQAARGAAQPGDQRDPEGAGNARPAFDAGRRSAHGHARGVRRDDGERREEMGEGRRGGGHQAAVMRNDHGATER